MTVEEETPVVHAAYTRLKEALTTARTTWDERRQDLVFGVLESDRQRYFELVRKLRAPQAGGGELANFRFQLAKDEALLAFKEIQSDEYKPLAQAWIEDVGAFDALFKNLVAAYADKKLRGTKFEYEDARGKTKSGTIKGITSTGVELSPKSLMDGKDELRYADLGVKWILERLFLHTNKDKQLEPRMEMGAADWHGLAVLAEMAGAYDDGQVAKYWSEAQKAYGDDKAGAHIERLRIGLGRTRLERESQAATKWFRSLEIYLGAEDFEKRRRPWVLGHEEWPAEDREAIQKDKQQLFKNLMLAQGMIAELKTDVALAATTWATSLRDGGSPHPKVAYAGEPLRPPGKKRGGATPPKDDDGKKDGDEAVSNGGGSVKKGDGKKGDGDTKGGAAEDGEAKKGDTEDGAPGGTKDDAKGG